MNIYSRDQLLQRWLLRGFFLLSLFLSIYSFKTGYPQPGVLLVISLLAGAFFQITDLDISENSITVRRYYFFGYLFWTWRFQKTATIQAYTLVLRDDDTIEADSAWDLLLVFLPLVTVRLPRYSISGNGREVRLKLYAGEPTLISQFLTK